MEPKESIVTQLEKILKEQEKENSKNETYSSLNRANDFYNKMIDQGITKKRGFTLRGIEDNHLFQIRINS